MADKRQAGGGRGEDAHEGTQVDGRRVAGSALAVIGLIAVALTVAFAVHDLTRHRTPVAHAGTGLKPAPSTPRLEPTAGEDLKAFNAEKHKLLDSYAWIDRDAGIVRIPIDRAMSVLAQRGETPSASARAAGQ